MQERHNARIQNQQDLQRRRVQPVFNRAPRVYDDPDEDPFGDDMGLGFLFGGEPVPRRPAVARRRAPEPQARRRHLALPPRAAVNPGPVCQVILS
jgi:hypothetical protein